MSYPFITYKNQVTQIGGTKELILGEDVPLILDGLWLLNVGDDRAEVTVDLLTERSGTIANTMLIKRYPLASYAKDDILRGSMMYLEAGDTLHGWTEFSGSTVQIIISYRQLHNQREVIYDYAKRN